MKPMMDPSASYLVLEGNCVNGSISTRMTLPILAHNAHQFVPSQV